MGEKIYAVRMKEYCKPKGHLRRTYIGYGERRYAAGDATPNRPFRPSPIVVVTKDEAEYLTGKRVNGELNVSQPNNPHVPVFDLVVADDATELTAMAQKEADVRAALGQAAARAMIQAPQLAQIHGAPLVPAAPAPPPPAPKEDEQPANTVGSPVDIDGEEKPEENAAPAEKKDNQKKDNRKSGGKKDNRKSNKNKKK